MTELHPGDGYQILAKPFSNTGRVTEASERPSVERTSDSAIQRNWEMFAIWSFVIFSFALHIVRE